MHDAPLQHNAFIRQWPVCWTFNSLNYVLQQCSRMHGSLIIIHLIIKLSCTAAASGGVLLDCTHKYELEWTKHEKHLSI